MNKYIAFYKNKQIEVSADTSYQAQLLAQNIFKNKKSYDITVMLVEKKGIEIEHSTSAI